MLHYLPQLYKWQRLPRVLCGWVGLHYKVPQDIFYAGEKRQVKHYKTSLFLLQALICPPYSPLHFTDTGRGLSVTLPASSTSYQVTGLRLGRRYRFTIQPTFGSGLGTESSVDERTGNMPTFAYSYSHHSLKYLFILH